MATWATLRPPRLGRADERIVEGRGREEEIDGDEAGELAEVVAQALGRTVSRGVVLPDRRDAVVRAPVPVEVGGVDVVAPAPGLRAGGEVVEPVPAVRPAPGHHLPRGPLHPEVVARVRIGLVRLGVDVELEIGPAVPVDEVQGVSAIGGIRIVVDEPFLRLGGVDGEDLVPAPRRSGRLAPGTPFPCSL